MDNPSQVINIVYKDTTKNVGNPSILSKENIKEDISDYFKLLKTKYSLYNVLSKDLYETAYNNLINWSEEKESFTVAEFENKLLEESYFIVDGHFSIEDTHPISYKNYIDKEWKFVLQNDTYYTYYNGNKYVFNAFSNGDIIFNKYLDNNGNVYYVPCLLSATKPEKCEIILNNTINNETVVYSLNFKSIDKITNQSKDEYNISKKDGSIISDNGLTYVYIPTWSHKNNIANLCNDKAKKVYKNTDVLVIDLSINRGGYADLYHSWFNLIDKNKIKNIILLIGKKTASASEIALLDLVHKYDCVVIGTNTDGAFLTCGQMNYYLKNSKLEIGIPCAYRDKNLANPALANLECIGISPDILCDASSSQDLLNSVGKFLINYGYATQEQVDAVLK